MAQASQPPPGEAFIPEVFLDDPDSAATPQPLYQLLRDRGPAFRERHGIRVVDADLARQVLNNPELFQSGGTVAPGCRPLIPLQVDPPEHHRYRQVLDPLLTAPEVLASLQPEIVAVTSALLNRIQGQQRCDAMAQFCMPLPAMVLLAMMGLPQTDLPQLLQVKAAIAAAAAPIRPPKQISSTRQHQQDDFDPQHQQDQKNQHDQPDEQDQRAQQHQRDRRDDRVAADAEIDRYFTPVLGARRRRPGSDLISHLLETPSEGQGLTDQEVLDICGLLALAGIDPIAATLGGALVHLAGHPSQRHRLATEDPSTVDVATDELIRWVSAVALVGRVATKDTMIGDCPIKSGELVTVLLGATNTDPKLVPNPGLVDLTRRPNPHLAFGAGIHQCLGEHLAKLEMRIALRLWHRRIPDYKVASNAQLRYDFPQRTLHRLPLAFVGPAS
jgi:cytochrome P450